MPGEVVSPVGKGKNHAEALNRLPYLECWTGTCFWVLLENYKKSSFHNTHTKHSGKAVPAVCQMPSRFLHSKDARF